MTLPDTEALYAMAHPYMDTARQLMYLKSIYNTDTVSPTDLTLIGHPLIVFISLLSGHPNSVKKQILKTLTFVVKNAYQIHHPGYAT